MLLVNISNCNQRDQIDNKLKGRECVSVYVLNVL